MKVYTNHDWRVNAHEKCSGINPTVGNKMDPLEILFWKQYGLHKTFGCQKECVLDTDVDLKSSLTEREVEEKRKIDFTFPVYRCS